MTETQLNGASDFDFLIGRWSVAHRRLKRRLARDSEWIEFEGPARAYKILAGCARSADGGALSRGARRVLRC